jgi:hypothetical protein
MTPTQLQHVSLELLAGRYLKEATECGATENQLQADGLTDCNLGMYAGCGGRVVALVLLVHTRADGKVAVGTLWAVLVGEGEVGGLGHANVEEYDNVAGLVAGLKNVEDRARRMGHREPTLTMVQALASMSVERARELHGELRADSTHLDGVEVDELVEGGRVVTVSFMRSLHPFVGAARIACVPSGFATYLVGRDGAAIYQVGELGRDNVVTYGSVALLLDELRRLGNVLGEWATETLSTSWTDRDGTVRGTEIAV